ncbi:MAG: hypothetical protein HYU54_07110, partial [Actinobacteria bacterium]|nr:hypothetical protein [Actinomycetota bacterium]
MEREALTREVPTMSVVTEYLEARGVPFEVIEHPRAFTSVAEARALGVEA